MSGVRISELVCFMVVVIVGYCCLVLIFAAVYCFVFPEQFHHSNLSSEPSTVEELKNFQARLLEAMQSKDGVISYSEPLVPRNVHSSRLEVDEFGIRMNFWLIDKNVPNESRGIVWTRAAVSLRVPYFWGSEGPWTIPKVGEEARLESLFVYEPTEADAGGVMPPQNCSEGAQAAIGNSNYGAYCWELTEFIELDLQDDFRRLFYAGHGIVSEGRWEHFWRYLYLSTSASTGSPPADIVPFSNPARWLLMFQQLLWVIFLALLSRGIVLTLKKIASRI